MRRHQPANGHRILLFRLVSHARIKDAVLTHVSGGRTTQ
jgi:hypothetical protein